MALSKSSILFHKRWNDGNLEGPHARLGAAFEMDLGSYQWLGSHFEPRVRQQPRFEPLAGNNFRSPSVGLLCEPASEQEVQAPFNFADAAWALQNGMTRADAASIFRGQTASRLTTPTTTVGSAGIYDDFGTWTGDPETATWIVEQGNFPTCVLLMWAPTGTVSVHQVLLTFATGALAIIASAGTNLAMQAIKLADSGPNGGKVYLVRLTASYSGASARMMYLYGDTSVTPPSASHLFVHYMGWEVANWGSNPIAGPANNPLSPTVLAYKPIPTGVPIAGLYECTLGERSALGSTYPYRTLFSIGDNVNQRFIIWLATTSNNLYATFDDGIDSRSSFAPAALVPGDRLLITWKVHPATGTLYLQAKINSGTLLGDQASSGGYSVAWGGTQLIRIGHSGVAGASCRHHAERALIVSAADMVSPLVSADMHQELDLFERSIMGDGRVL